MNSANTFAYDAKYFGGKMSTWTELSFETISHKLRHTLETQVYPKGGVVLDYGCGSGVYCNALRTTGLKVVGADISPSALDSAKQQPYYNLISITEDRLPLPDGSVSVLFTTEVLEHIEHVGRTIAEFNRLIETGGVLIVTTTLYCPSINTYLSSAIIDKHSPFLVVSQVCAYICGYFSVEWQARFVKRWCYAPLGGHFHGFHIRQLKNLLVSNGFEIVEVAPMYIFEPVGFTKWLDATYLKSAPIRKRLLWTLPMLALKALNFILKAFKFTANNIYLVARKGGGS